MTVKQNFLPGKNINEIDLVDRNSHYDLASTNLARDKVTLFAGDDPSILAHETGHLLGAKDQYTRDPNDPFKAVSNPGHEHEIMGANASPGQILKPLASTITEILGSPFVKVKAVR